MAVALALGAWLLGPAAAGFGIGLIGVKPSYAIGVALYAIALLLLFKVNRAPPEAGARDTSMWQNVIEGFNYISGNRLVLVLLAFGLVPMFLAMPFQTLLVVFAKEQWDVGAAGFGGLQAVAGLGGLLGALWVAWLGVGLVSPPGLGAAVSSGW